jgi:choline kinase
VILAAGCGSRIDGAIESQPKCLAVVGGRTLLDYQLSLLEEVGITRICVVVGYRGTEVSKVVGTRAECIHNSLWKETDSLYSLWLSRKWVTGSFVVMNCDVLLHPEVLRRILAKRGSAFAYDSSSGTEHEHMKVEFKNGYLHSISKTLPPERSHGENVGTLYFNNRTAQLLFREADLLIKSGNKQMWMAAAVQQVARRARLRGIDVSDLPWIEIDFPSDLRKAREITWPAISVFRPMQAP